jgi:hypothetical protein
VMAVVVCSRTTLRRAQRIINDIGLKNPGIQSELRSAKMIELYDS